MRKESTRYSLETAPCPGRVEANSMARSAVKPEGTHAVSCLIFFFDLSLAHRGIHGIFRIFRLGGINFQMLWC